MRTPSVRRSLAALAFLGATTLPLAMACAERPGKPKVEDDDENEAGKKKPDAKASDAKKAKPASPAEIKPEG